MSTQHYAKIGRSYDMGTFDFGIDLTGTTARCRFGKRSNGNFPGEKRLELSSASPPAQGIFQWTAADGELRIDLHQSQIATISEGAWTYEIDVIRPTGEVLEGPSGEFIVLPQIPD